MLFTVTFWSWVRVQDILTQGETDNRNCVMEQLGIRHFAFQILKYTFPSFVRSYVCYVNKSHSGSVPLTSRMALTLTGRSAGCFHHDECSPPPRKTEFQQSEKAFEIFIPSPKFFTFSFQRKKRQEIHLSLFKVFPFASLTLFTECHNSFSPSRRPTFPISLASGNTDLMEHQKNN